MASSLTTPKSTIHTTPLTSESFAKFGTVISAPISCSVSTIPHSPPPNASYANQKTALKFADVAPISSMYRLSPSGAPAYPTMSLFSCFPRTLRSSDNDSVFDVRILERHPFTTQTFAPLASRTPVDSKAIIIVAPTLTTSHPPAGLTPYFPKSRQGGQPDLKALMAFVAEPGMGVTYGVGTWHAPLVVVGHDRMDFVVTQWISGRGDEDCQEIEVGEGLEVIVDDQKSLGARKERAKL